MPRKPLDRRGMLAALPPFCQNGVGYFATTDRSEFCRKISSFGFSPAVERLIAPFAGQGDQQAPIDRLKNKMGFRGLAGIRVTETDSEDGYG